MATKTLSHQGHLIDSGTLSKILDIVLQEGADYKILQFDIGKTPKEESRLRIMLKTEHEEALEVVTGKLVPLGVYSEGECEAVWEEVVSPKAAPDGFYSTTNHLTEVYIEGAWRRVKNQRMDAAVVLRQDGPCCVKLRELLPGDRVLIGSESVRVHPPDTAGMSKSFSFMNNEVSSERSAASIATKVATELKSIREDGGKIVVVAGPVVVHTGGADALASLVRNGWISGFLGGNAIAVHDLEYRLLGTSLGVDLETGRPTQEGHKNHMIAINKVYQCGSIQGLIDAGELECGLMYELLKAQIPYCLAGSIRDDGPLPETEMDMIKAQEEYARIIQGAEMIIMLSSMLHSIGVGNMTPSWVKTICVDINPAVVTKLSDRGSAQAIGVVSDVGLFLRTIETCLNSTKTA